MEKKSGLRGIEEMLFKGMSTKQGQNGLTASEALSKNEQMRTEIDSLAKKIASESKTAMGGDRSSPLRGLTMDIDSISTNSRLIGKDNAALKRISDNFNNQVTQDLEKYKEDLQINTIQGSGGDAARVLAGINTNTLRADKVDKELIKYENKTVGSCFQEYVKKNGGSIDGFVNKFYDPTVSKKKNRGADNSFKNFISSLINQAHDIDIKELIKKLEMEQVKGTNAKYFMTTGKSRTITRRVGSQLKIKRIGASTRQRPAAILGVFAENCRDQFDHLETNGISMRQAVNNISAYAKMVDKKRKEASSKILAAVKSELKDCPGDKTTGSAALSCTEALDRSNSNFCVRTAVKCANNLKSCHNKAKKTVQTIRDTQVATAGVYNGQVETLKNQMQQDITNLNLFMESQSRLLDGQLNIGSVFKVPPISFDITPGTHLLRGEGIDDSLNLEDPDQYLKVATDHLDKLIESLKDQRNETLAKVNKIKDTYIENYANQVSFWNGIAGSCQGIVKQGKDALQKSQAESAKQQGEIAATCKKISAFNRNPQGFCGKAGDLADSVLKASSVYGAADQAYGTLNAYDNSCKGSSSSSDPKFVRTSQVFDFCKDGGSGSSECSKINKVKEESEIISSFNQEYCINKKEERKIKKDGDEECEGDLMAMASISDLDSSGQKSIMDKYGYTKDFVLDNYKTDIDDVKKMIAENSIKNQHGNLGQQSDTRIPECQGTSNAQFTAKGTGSGGDFFQQAAALAGRALATKE